MCAATCLWPAFRGGTCRPNSARVANLGRDSPGTHGSSSRVPHFHCSYNKKAKKTPGKGGLRFYKNVGLGFHTPKEAIEGEEITS